LKINRVATENKLKNFLIFPDFPVENRKFFVANIKCVNFNLESRKAIIKTYIIYIFIKAY